MQEPAEKVVESIVDVASLSKSLTVKCEREEVKAAMTTRLGSGTYHMMATRSIACFTHASMVHMTVH